ncbi:hypothetical protein [Peribacillus simplex]|uniref:hypothetical protein n=1 Tax=Peribacillus simplex TaxID=1478 RepID=UPI002698A0AF
MGILSENPKEEPMHYGEVFGTWAFLTTKGLIAPRRYCTDVRAIPYQKVLNSYD